MWQSKLLSPFVHIQKHKSLKPQSLAYIYMWLSCYIEKNDCSLTSAQSVIVVIYTEQNSKKLLIFIVDIITNLNVCTISCPVESYGWISLTFAGSDHQKLINKILVMNKKIQESFRSLGCKLCKPNNSMRGNNSGCNCGRVEYDGHNCIQVQ